MLFCFVLFSSPVYFHIGADYTERRMTQKEIKNCWLLGGRLERQQGPLSLYSPATPPRIRLKSRDICRGEVELNNTEVLFQPSKKFKRQKILLSNCMQPLSQYMYSISTLISYTVFCLGLQKIELTNCFATLKTGSKSMIFLYFFHQ